MNDRELSEQAGLDEDVYTWNQIQLERFAELIRKDEREWFLKVLYLFEDSYSSSKDDVTSIKERVIQRGVK